MKRHNDILNRCYIITDFIIVPSDLSRFPVSDACRPATGMDAQIIRRAVSEPFEKTQDRLRELVRPSIDCVHPSKVGRTGRHWFWGLLQKQKDRAIRQNTMHGRKGNYLKPLHWKSLPPIPIEASIFIDFMV